MTTADRLAAVLCAVHAAAVRTLPRSFQARFGDEVREAFRAGVRAVLTDRGVHAALWFTACELGSIAGLAVGERQRLGDTPVRGRRTGWDEERREEKMQTLVKDLVVALRMFRRRPIFALVAVGTLALGIGANTAMFSVVNSVLIRPLPFPDDHELVRVFHVDGETGNRRGSLSLPDRDELAGRSASLREVGVYSTVPSGPLLTGGEEPVELDAAYVSPGFFPALGRDAMLGRPLLDEESRTDPQVVVLSHAFWQTRFGADEAVVGRTIQLDDAAYRVVGVMPPDFTFPSATVQAWLFLGVIPESSIPLQVRQVRFLEAIARLQPGLAIGAAEAELATVAGALADDYPDAHGSLVGQELVPLRESMTGDVSTTLLVLLGAVGLVLVIACANVANLLFSRGLERSRELTVRRALGAGRGRLVRQLMTETFLLALVGGGAGLVLALALTRALVAASPSLLPRVDEIGIDPLVLGFALLSTLLTAAACGLAPALRMTGGGSEAPVPSARGAAGRSRSGRAQSLVVAGQVSLAIVVVIGSGLLVRSLIALQQVDSGMEVERLVALSLTINDSRYPDRPAYLAAYDRITDDLERLPEVEAVGSIRSLPMTGGGESTEFGLVDRAAEPGGPTPRATRLQVSPGFFATAGIELLAGREFSTDDHADAAPVVVINDALRRRYWPGDRPVGQFLTGIGPEPVMVVGVVADIRQDGLVSPAEPTVYVPQAQNPRRGMTFLIRTQDPAAALAPIRDAVRTGDPDQPIDRLEVMTDVVRGSVSRPRFFSALLGGFAALALVLAAFGIYGVVSHSVSRRVAEIGIRVALGAPGSGVIGLVVRGGMGPVLIGAMVGVALSMVATRLLESTLFGVGSRDPLTFVVVPLLMMTIALLACVVPARRALQVDPARALRSE